MERDIFRPGGLKLTEICAQRAGLTAQSRVLDIGCGLGASLNHLRTRFGVEAVGADISAPTVEKARALHPGISFFHADGTALPFADGSFDAVFIECALSLAENPEAMLQEAGRVLRPGGFLAVSTLSRTAGNVLVESGAVCLPALEACLIREGFMNLETEDHTGELRQLLAEAIFQYGSIERWLGEAGRALGGTVLGCNISPKALCYHLVTAGKSGASADYKTYREQGRFTTEADIRRLPEAFLRVPAREVARIITLQTSGSTAKPKRLFFTENDMLDTVEFFAPGMSPMVKAGERAAVFMEGPGEYTVGGLLTAAITRLGGETRVHGLIRDYGQAARNAEGAACLVGLPGQLAALAAAAPHLRPKTALMSGDYVPESIERRLEDVWGCEVFCHWGMTETAYGGAVECSRHTGYHLRPDLLVEIVSPETGEPLPDGAFGEVIITTLKREAMPLIRYRTGDRGMLLPGICPCGNPSPRLDKVNGRISDGITLPLAGAFSIHLLDEELYSLPDLKDYRARLSGNKLNITCDGGKPDEIVRRLRTRWPGLQAEVISAELPPEPGKRRLEIAVF